MKGWRSKRLVLLVLALSVFWLSVPEWSLAAGNDIVLDGGFADWDGQSNMTDRTEDAFLSGDITEFAWAANDSDSNLYFMIKRNRYNDVWDMAPAFYKVNLDISNNGIFHNGNDRFLLVSYFPHLDGLVYVSLFKGNGKLIKTYWGDWGEAVSQDWAGTLPDNWGEALPGNWIDAFPEQWSGTVPKDWGKWFHRGWGEAFPDRDEWFPGDWGEAFPEDWGGTLPTGGTQCEFYVSMDDLSMYPGQPIRMYVESIVLPPDRVPDSGDIQWSPIPIMPAWALAGIFVAGLAVAVIIIKRRRVA